MIRNFSVENKSFLNAYIKLEDDSGNSSVNCQVLGEINPETFDSQKALAITEALGNCLSQRNPNTEIITLNKIDGKKFVVT